MRRTIHQSISGLTAIELDKLFVKYVYKQPGAVGMIVIAYDGRLIASFVPENVDIDSVAICAHDAFRSSEQAVAKLNYGRLHEIVSLGPQGSVISADFGGGLLFTLNSNKEMYPNLALV
jgi:predicted regulator of Ras-like GTPase activity (Roadblock/LC7/MglB family)